MATIFVNGRITGEQDAVIPVLDHGFLYGEGVYEVMRTYNQKPFLYGPHMDRLRKSASMINLDIPFSDDDLLSWIRDTARVFHERPGGGETAAEMYIRVLVTRGVGPMTYDPAACPKPTVVIIIKPQVDPSPEAYAKGVKVILVPVVRNHPYSINPLIKSNNLLNNALASQFAMRNGGFEAIMRNYRSEISECAQSNLFVVKDGSVLTPPIEAGLLAGITRAFVFEVGARCGVDVRERTLNDEDLFGADEMFLTSTTREIVPIVTVNESTIGPGVPGPITLKLLAKFRKRAKELSE